jgi:enamine deaminase RidA (YjgF/YER057c/UK114 family)
MSPNPPGLRFSNPTTMASPDGHFSQCAVLRPAAGVLCISGQVPRGPDGQTVGAGDMARQAEQVFENLRLALAAEGCDFADVFKVNLYVTRMDLADQVVQVRRRFYGQHRPTSTFVGVTALGDPDWWLEVEVMAQLRQDSVDAAHGALVDVAQRYIRAWYDGDGEAAEQLLHPTLAKRLIERSAEGQSVLEHMGADELIANCRGGSGRSTPSVDRLADVTVLDVHGDAATVKVVASRWIDYLHLARIDGRWWVVNCLWAWR